jgi:hypothetical protein
MPHLSLSGFGTVFDFGQQLRLNPNAAMCDLFCVGLGLADQRLQPGLQGFR